MAAAVTSTRSAVAGNRDSRRPTRSDMPAGSASVAGMAHVHALPLCTNTPSSSIVRSSCMTQERIALGVTQHEVEQVVAEIRTMQRPLQPLAHFGRRQALQTELAYPLVAREPLPALTHDAVRRLFASQRERDEYPLAPGAAT